MTLESTSNKQQPSCEDYRALLEKLSSGELQLPFNADGFGVGTFETDRRYLFLSRELKNKEQQILSKNKKCLGKLRSDYMFSTEKFCQRRLFVRDIEDRPQYPALKRLSGTTGRDYCWEIKNNNLRLIGFFFRTDIFIACFVIDKGIKGKNTDYAPAIDATIKKCKELALPHPQYLDTKEHDDVASNIRRLPQ